MPGPDMQPAAMPPEYTEAYKLLLDHHGECMACHVEGMDCSEGDRLRGCVRDTRPKAGAPRV